MPSNSAQAPLVIDLAREAAFRLGAVDVRPNSLELVRGGQGLSLEPRIMQVLVVLARAEGSVVSRAELVERCWNGRIVGDNAINRVLSQIRKLAAGIGEGRFALETIPTIGYRLKVTDFAGSAPAAGPFEGAAGEAIPAAAAPVAATAGTPAEAAVAAPAAAAADAAGSLPPASARFDRRLILGAAALGGAGGLAWWRLRAQAGLPLPAARILYDKGVEAQVQARREQGLQAAAYFREALRLDPGYADAWGRWHLPMPPSSNMARRRPNWRGWRRAASPRRPARWRSTRATAMRKSRSSCYGRRFATGCGSNATPARRWRGTPATGA